MSITKTMAGILALGLFAACGGAGQQQADATQPASDQNPPATASTEPAPPAQEQPPAKPSRQAAPTQRQAAARQATPSPVPAQAAPPPAPPAVLMVSVPAGTVLSLALDNGISSKTALAGDTFTATVVEPVEVNGQQIIPAGAQVEGKVTESVPAKRGAGNAKLAVSFDVLSLPGGHKVNIVGSFREVTESKKKRNAAIIGGSAAGGALLGRILGKDTKGAVVGALVAGGVGTAVVMGKEGEQAKIPANTPFEIKLEEAVKVPQAPPRS